MIIFYDKRDGQIFGTIDGRVHEKEFAKIALMGSSSIPEDQVGKFIVPTKPVEEVVNIPIKAQYADPYNGFKVEEVVIGNNEEVRVKELVFDVPFAEKLAFYEDPLNTFQLVNCKVELNDKEEIIDIVENNV